MANLFDGMEKTLQENGPKKSNVGFYIVAAMGLGALLFMYCHESGKPHREPPKQIEMREQYKKSTTVQPVYRSLSSLRDTEQILY